MQMIYKSPTVIMYRVILERGLTQVVCSPAITVEDWENDPSDTPATNNQDVLLDW
jgi:hypothetical protein